MPCVPLVYWRVQNFQAQTQRRFAQYQNIPTHKGAAVVGRARRAPLFAPAALAFAPVVQQVIHTKNAQYVQQAAHMVKVGVGVEYGGQVRRVIIGQGRGHQRLARIKTRRGAAPAVQQQAHMPRQTQQQGLTLPHIQHIKANVV